MPCILLGTSRNLYRTEAVPGCAGAARKRAKLVETASSRAMSEAPSDTNSLEYGMSPGMAGDLSDSDLPSTQGEQLPTDGPPPTVEVPSSANNS